jgi:hypothetical protein
MFNFLCGDQAGMEKRLAATSGRPGWEDLLLSAQSDTEAFHGRLGKARDLSQRAVESARRGNLKEAASYWTVNGAMREAEFDNSAAANELANSALQISSGQNAQTLAALTLARSGQIERAQKMADSLAKEHRSDTMLNFYWLPTIRAAIEPDRHNPANAIEILRTASPYEFGLPPPLQSGPLYPISSAGPHTCP